MCKMELHPKDTIELHPKDTIELHPKDTMELHPKDTIELHPKDTMELHPDDILLFCDNLNNYIKDDFVNSLVFIYGYLTKINGIAGNTVFFKQLNNEYWDAGYTFANTVYDINFNPTNLTGLKKFAFYFDALVYAWNSQFRKNYPDGLIYILTILKNFNHNQYLNWLMCTTMIDSIVLGV